MQTKETHYFLLIYSKHVEDNRKPKFRYYDSKEKQTFFFYSQSSSIKKNNTLLFVT